MLFTNLCTNLVSLSSTLQFVEKFFIFAHIRAVLLLLTGHKTACVQANYCVDCVFLP